MLFEIDTLLLTGAILLSVLALIVAVRPIITRRIRPQRNRSAAKN
jgi:hypothetical protein